MKSYWFDRRMRFNLAVFYSKYTDMQIVYPIDPTEAAKSQVLNAGKADIKGVEVEWLVQPLDDLSLNLNDACLSTEIRRIDVVPGSLFDRNSNPRSPCVPGDNIKDLFALPHAPQHSFGLSANYRFFRFERGRTSAALSYRRQDRNDFLAAGGPLVPGRDFDRQRPYGLLNGRVTLALDLPRGEQIKTASGERISPTRNTRVAMPRGGASVPAGAAPPATTPPPSPGRSRRATGSTWPANIEPPLVHARICAAAANDDNRLTPRRQI